MSTSSSMRFGTALTCGMGVSCCWMKLVMFLNSAEKSLIAFRSSVSGIRLSDGDAEDLGETLTRLLMIP